MAIAEVPPGPSRGDGRVPPYNLEAEESLLGAMLLSKDAIVAASELGVTAADFYKPVHGHIFDAITSLYAAGEPADPVTVAETLRRSGLLADIGGPALLVSLQVRTPATSSAARYARIVNEHALLRRLIAVAGEIAEMGYQVPDDVAEAVDRAEAMVFDVAQHRVSDSMAAIRDLLDESLTRLEMLYEKADAITGIPTGYQGLDELLSGLQPSSLVIVGARPATGKCLTGDTLLVDPRTGARTRLDDLHHRGRAGADVEVTTLGDDRRLRVRRPSAFVDDGVHPVFRVRTRSGRHIRTTAAHPFLTPTGWRPLSSIGEGTPIAVPRTLPLFGTEEMPEDEVVMIAHLMDDQAQATTALRFGAATAPVMADIAAHGRRIGIGGVAERGVPGARACLVTPDRSRPDALAQLLARHGLLGVRPHRRRVPDAVFRLPRHQLALFLNRVLGDGGSAWWAPRGGGSACISYCNLSAEVVADIAHLLLRFGINARRRRRVVHRPGWRGPAHELEVTASAEIRTLASEIGMFSKDAALANLVSRISQDRCGGGRERAPGPTRPTLVAAGAAADRQGGAAPPRPGGPPRRRPPPGWVWSDPVPVPGRRRTGPG
ncbi:MAG TPA: DnaB-like helicase N-terminal domain-containing protein [Acidimicrobiales bacterium]|nr:DnaB-like helicase N-terminal domain-containing protein [Acidimicrobiales bacterium]